MACSNFMPLPLISYDWELDEKEIFTNPIIYKQIFYIFQKNKAVISFKISSNSNKGPIGCSTLSNEAFLKNFERHSSNMTSFNTIDI